MYNVSPSLIDETCLKICESYFKAIIQLIYEYSVSFLFILQNVPNLWFIVTA